jgi:hypothetical protein
MKTGDLEPRVVRLGREDLSVSTAENSKGTVRRIGRPFQPGQSGNPGGRPKGVAKAVRDASGGDPTMLVEGLLEIARGEGMHGKPVRDADRIRAYELVLAYGWGKPPQFAPVEAADPLELGEVARELQLIMDELQAKREANQGSIGVVPPAAIPS